VNKRYIIDNSIWAAHEIGYPDAVDFLRQITLDKIIIDITTVIQMELLSHFEIDKDETIKMGREGYISLAHEV
jgi:hypothetical protein